VLTHDGAAALQLGFHPGSGSQRPLFVDCVSRRNCQGIFFCWGVTDGIVRRCVCANNRKTNGGTFSIFAQTHK